MKKLKVYLIFIITLNSIYAQKNMDDIFVIDSINHMNYVNSYIDKIRKVEKEIIIISEFSYASNNTIIHWKENNSLKSVLITNKKLNKKIRKRKIKISTIEEEKILKILCNDIDYSYLKDLKDCENISQHNYIIKFEYKKQSYNLKSKCLPKLREYETIAVFINLLDKVSD